VNVPVRPLGATLASRLALALALVASLFIALLPSSPASASAERNIVDTAVSAGSFTTLATALQAAGLVDTLKGPGPYTVFAPTDAAFAKLPPGTVDALVKDPEQLRAVLLYHVIPGQVTASQIAVFTGARTVGGQPLAFSVDGGMARVNGASVVQADVMAANGVIHVIDTVLIPPTAPAPAPVTRGDRDPNRGLGDDVDCDEVGADLTRCPN
jgi:uncharacterized surface protein with fasciclin (FAS1) repeats